MQCFYPSIEHLWESGVCAQIGDLEAGVAQGFGRATGGDKLNTGFLETFREID